MLYSLYIYFARWLFSLLKSSTLCCYSGPPCVRVSMEHAEGSGFVWTILRTTDRPLHPAMSLHSWHWDTQRLDFHWAPWGCRNESFREPEPTSAASPSQNSLSSKCTPREMHRDQLNHAGSLRTRGQWQIYAVCYSWFNLHNEFWWALSRLTHWLTTTAGMLEFSNNNIGFYRNRYLAWAIMCKRLCPLKHSCAW